MNWNLALSVLVVGSLVAMIGCTMPCETPGAAVGVEKDGDLPAAVVQSAPKPQRQLHEATGYSGVVISAGPDWVELGAGWEGSSVNGVKEWKEQDSKKPRRISAAGTPPGGDPNATEGIASVCRGATHLTSDLKVGDVVGVFVGVNRAGDEWAMQIIIRRRPGGRIPPQSNDSLAGTEHALHFREQAEQDWEENGAPIPKKYLNKVGHAPWTNPPYPPVAPMPRIASRDKP